MTTTPDRLSRPELDTLRRLMCALTDLRAAEGALQRYETTTPNVDRQTLLAGVRAAIRNLEALPKASPVS